MSPSRKLLPPARIGKLFQVLDLLELPGHAHLHEVGAGIHHAGRFHRVLLADLRQHLVEVQAELRQALLRHLDEQLLVLRAEQRHLGHVGHLQQLLAHAVGMVAQLLVAEAVGRQRIDRAVDIAELVVEERADHTGWQRGAQVADLLAHRVPDLRHRFGRRRVLHLEDDQRLARLAVAADLVRVGHLLQRALDLVGHLLGHLLRGGTRPEHADGHGAEGERRVLVLAQLEVGRAAQHQQHHQQVARQCRMLDRPARDVETLARRIGALRLGRQRRQDLGAHLTRTGVTAGWTAAEATVGST